ncbi:MAG: transglycosylase domain-containing protein [Desulfocapsa sp.]|nr:transglycosylase domain-containing protein [Desulfocapsa sp.]
MFKKIILFFLSLAILLLLAVWGVLHWLVVLHPGEEVAIENIRSILGKESPVLYSDGVTPLGVFFDEAHRQYVTWEQIPENFVNALVASEDNRFFYHYGFDVISIGRAAIKNYEAGRVVQGGSTLTQQTAKNLFKRSGRSYEAKLKELLSALRLEYHYSKEMIFEFYSNQFYVRGNGHGLGVAARYYFDKNVEDLSLLECVFIAGSVKRPNYYNPFRRKSEEGKKEIRRRINERVGYVLGQMKQLGMLSQEQYEQAKNSDVVFTEGQVGYELDYVMEMIRDAVGSQEVQEALEKHGIGNLATAGLRVISSVDKGLQENILYILRRELSRVDIRLRGYEREEVQEELGAADYYGDQELKEKSFLFATITEIDQDSEGTDGSLKISVDFTARGLEGGVIDSKGIVRPLQALVKWKKNRWSEVAAADTPLLLAELQVGDRVWVSVRDIDSEGNVLLDLERFPKLKGGALVLQNGMIKAMAGGVENRFFNRATSARRTMGSAFKPFVYAAALQLGWNTVDLLKNSRDIFVFQGQSYFPRPDHKSPHKEVSMSWAGVHSENLASIWLLYHLCDRLSSAEFKELVEKVDLAPRVRNGKKEPYNLYRTRTRDTNGIVLNRSILQEAAYTLAVQHLETDFIFENLAEEYQVLRSLHYGLNFDKYKEEIGIAFMNDELPDSAHKEFQFRKNLLKTSYLYLVLRQQQLKDFQKYLGEIKYNSFNVVPFVHDAALYFNESLNRYTFVAKENLTKNLSLVDTKRLLSYLDGSTEEGRAKFWDDVLLDSTMSSAAVSLVEKQVKREYQRLSALPPYSLEVLAGVPDFRILAGLRYLIDLAREAGISSQLEPVLSFPLGSNVVTLLEAVRLYETLITGEVALLEAESDENRDLLTVLDRIETVEGEVVYQAAIRKKELFAPKPRLELNHVLENTVKFGTGRYAQKHTKLPANRSGSKEELEVLDLVIPLLGKTGTANNYTNASFLGYLPGVSDDGTGMVIDDGYALGVYVGFDNNTPMRRKTTRITGSGGALPAWTDMVNTILREKGYIEKLDPVDLSFYGLTLLHEDLGQMNIGVTEDSGGRVGNPAVEIDEKDRSHPSIMTFGQLHESGMFEPERLYVPFWGTGEQLIETDL